MADLCEKIHLSGSDSWAGVWSGLNLKWGFKKVKKNLNLKDGNDFGQID